MGNKIGWILAGVVVVAVAGFVIKFVYFPSATEATAKTLKKGVLDKQELKAELASVVSSVPSEDGNAADDYRKAVALYRDEKNKDILDDLSSHLNDIAGSKRSLPGNQVKLLEQIYAHVSAGAKKKSLQYVQGHEQAMSMKVNYPPAMELLDVQGALDILAAYYTSHNEFDNAAGVYQKLLIMGRQLVDERARPQMVAMGIVMQKDACGGISRALGKMSKTADEKLINGKIAAVADYERQVGSFDASYGVLSTVVQSAKLHAGDVFNVVENCKDPSWKVEGILTLSRLKFAIVKRGDIRKCDKLIERFCNSNDPLEKAAAQIARDFTEEDLNKLGN